MSEKVQMNSRVSKETFAMREKLLQKFNAELPVGSVNANEIVELAIKTLYEQYFTKPSVRSKVAQKYGANV